MTLNRLRTLWLLCCVANLYGFQQEFRFASYYGDHMVLQKAPQRAVVWGYGEDAAEVTVTVVGEREKVSHTVNVDKGIWRVTLDPVNPGGPFVLSAVQQSRLATTVRNLSDVLFGDVWLCGGQSNMEMTLSQVMNATEELSQAAKFPRVRVFSVALEKSDVKLTDLAGVELPWSVPSAEVLGAGIFTHFSAVCWLFGRDLYKSRGDPVGLVESCWGGTPVEAWSSRRALKHCGLADAPSRLQVKEGHWKNTVLWNAMIHPLLNMTIRGAIWYQGEANTEYHQDLYNCTFPAMIDDWRLAFHQGSGGQTPADLPFGFVQISTYMKKSQSDAYPNLRWQQTADFGFAPNKRMKNTFMAVSLDLGDERSPWGSIHPRYKQDVAYRLTLGARAVAYGEKVSFQGPFPQKISVQAANISIIYSTNISVTLHKSIFEVCCSRQREVGDSSSSWLPAPIIKANSDSVVLSTENCTLKVSGLRYAWKDWPCDFKACPVYSADGVLPAPPFIVDSGH
uniref:Sialic acid acetylesterase n=1 Tax=Lepisosteus oculatus TaxID=7918 RepID=W5M5G7_LEPOC|nr:PREDICTED: sialate O-acetylesterase isoform X1 [Lepisosteus oculatus]